MNSIFTDIGRVESDIRDLRRQIERKADDYKVCDVNSKMDRLEHTTGQIRSTCDGLESRLQDVESYLQERREQGLE